MTRRALLAVAASAFAAERKNRAPVSREPLTVKIPQASPVKISNGMTVLAIEDNRLPLVWAKIQVDGAGKIYDPRPGVAECTANMLVEGTRDRSGSQISEEAGRLGATFNTGLVSNREAATLDGSGLSGRFDEWLPLFGELLQHPSFPGDEFSNMRQRWLVNLRMRAAQPAEMADDRLMHIGYGNHPAGVVNPPPEALASVTPEMLAAWHRERYSAANTVISVIGRVRTSAVISQVEKTFGSWKTPEVKFTLPPEPVRENGRHIVLIDRPGAPQTTLSIGALLFERRHPDFFPMVILDNILAHGGTSRMVRLLEETGRAVRVNGGYGTARFTGYWRIRSATRTEATAGVLDTILAELRRACDEPVSQSELDAAKSAEIGRFALDLEQPSAVINYSYQRYRYGFSADYWDRYPARINAVTAAEVQAVAQKYFNPDRTHIVAVGDAARIGATLAKLGPVEA